MNQLASTRPASHQTITPRHRLETHHSPGFVLSLSVAGPHTRRFSRGSVPAPVNISVKRLKLRLSGSARKSQKRFRDTPMFKFLAVFVRIEPFQRSNERSERGDHPV
eukprot:COSAG06_NODE_371_length_16707_cov_57.805576_20_plen_107_part_00